MKKSIILTFVILMAIPMNIFGQSYNKMWKQLEEAKKKDLPQQVINHAQQIADKAKKEKKFGHLMKAQMTLINTKYEVSPDSLLTTIKRLESDLKATQDGRLRAVYATVLYHLYDWAWMDDSASIRAKEYATIALENPELLARTKTDVFLPFVIKKDDSRYFGHDLLSVIGMSLDKYDEMHDYYVKTGKREAACLSALWSMKRESQTYSYNWEKSDYIQKIDSLINEYGDLDVVAELAIARYRYMEDMGHASLQEQVAYIDEAVSRWPKWPKMNELRNKKSELTQSQYKVRMEYEVMNSGMTQNVELNNLRNLEQLTLRVYKTNLTGDEELDVNNDYNKLKGRLTLMPEVTQVRRYTGHAAYEEFKDTIAIGPLAKGIYMLEYESLPTTETKRCLLYVTDLFVMSQEQPNNQMRFVVVDRRTGQPVKDGRLLISTTRNIKCKDGKLLTCDAKGEAIFEKSGTIHHLYAYTPDDRAYLPTYANNGFSYYQGNRLDGTVNIYTDRSIYRPGQTVHAAVLLHVTEDYFKTYADANKKVTLALYDANYKVVEEKEVTTDQYGKASAEFVLPTGQLNGRFWIQCKGERQYFRVEEYKRPTYEVLFDEVREQYKAGDTLSVVGQARSYAGVGVQGAKVKYTVKRQVAFWWLNYSYYWDQDIYGYGREGTEELASGETTTDSNGRFTVDVPLTLPYYADSDDAMFYQFVIDADVTDQSGESRVGNTSIPLGTRPQILTSDLAEQVLAEELKQVTFRRLNAAGNDMEPAQVRFRIDNSTWQEATTGKAFAFDGTTLKSGLHELEAICQGDTLKQKFTIFSLDDTTPCGTTKDWFYASASQFSNDGTPVTIQVGSSDENVHMVYSIISGNKLLESGSVDQSNALWNRKFTYEESYGNGLLLSFAWVKDGKLYQHQTTIQRPVPDKRLTVRWETFRDRLKPGQKEEWTLVVLNPDGTPVDAQLMATMYDKSLEQLYKHHWSFKPNINIPLPSTSWYGSHWGRSWMGAERAWEPLKVSPLVFSFFGLGGPIIYSGDLNDVVVVGYGTQAVSSLGIHKRQKREELLVYDAAPMMERATIDEESQEEAGDQGDGGIQMRENLNETAFFYPTLTTDQNGRIAIKFTLPESLTTWRFMGIATTQDMKNGYIDGEAVAQKEVMIQPNMPRFLREGDKAVLSARIFNTTDHAVSGNSMIRLLDPETQKVIYKQSKPFSVKAGETAIVTFDVEPQSTVPLYICQVSASGKTFSDGEQHYLAVLPNQERVTVTVPFTQHEAGTKVVDIAKLFPSGTNNQKLTIEYTNNPAWLMVQALPSIGNPHELDAIDQAAWLYSNLIAKALIGKSAQIRNVFEMWKRETPTDGSLRSNLAKNEELKDILLAETPWVMDADRETEQKQRLADFFDENMMSQRIDKALKNLKDLQNVNGSWSWWPGMHGSFYMTVSIAEMLTRLNVMAGQQRTTSGMLDLAFRFMGQEMIDEVKRLKEWEKDGHEVGFPSFKALQYLYICALDGRRLPQDVQKANDYLIGKMKNDILNQTIYEKALSAIILAKNGEKKRSLEYAQSLKEYTVFTEEKGRYYDTRRASYSWYDYKIPTEVIAIEALKIITPEDAQTIEEMQRWLLQEKRTQAWDTPINSVNAVYAFLFDNTKLLDAQEQTQLAIDGRPLELPKATAGIGYVKTSIDQPKGRQFTAKKTSTGTSWGAVYAQFMQPVSEIESSASGITVKREILTNGPLKVGDRVKVRITIESERDLDFVQVIDRRAACMEPVQQLSGYRNGAYCSPKDYSTNYYYDMLSKGKHVIETEYFIDRVGRYESGTCVVQCAYSPEYRATAKSIIMNVEP